MRILRKMFAANNNNMAVADPLPAQRVQNQQAALQVKQQQNVNSQQRNMLSQQALPVKQQQVANTKLKNGIRQHSLSIKRSADSSRAIAEVNKMVDELKQLMPNRDNFIPRRFVLGCCS